MKMKNQEKFSIDQQELLNLCVGIDKSKFINLVTETITRMNKKGNPYHDKVIKRQTCNYLVGNEYQSRVRTNEIKEGGEGNFESEQNKIGTHISKCVLFNERTNQHYLMVEYFKESNPKIEYYFEGNTIEKHLFESWLVKKSETTRQPQERLVNVMSFKLSSIKKITLDGKKYEVVD